MPPWSKPFVNRIHESATKKFMDDGSHKKQHGEITDQKHHKPRPMAKTFVEEATLKEVPMKRSLG